jgi:hypothetical protein
MTTPSKPARGRYERHRRATPSTAGLPDPRPVTGYSVQADDTVEGTIVTVTLDQPCVIRAPMWALVECQSGARLEPTSVSVSGNTTFTLGFEGIVDRLFNFIEVPYQDMNVQNFQGGFVAPGARWFREPF